MLDQLPHFSTRWLVLLYIIHICAVIDSTPLVSTEACARCVQPNCAILHAACMVCLLSLLGASTLQGKQQEQYPATQSIQTANTDCPAGLWVWPHKPLPGLHKLDGRNLRCTGHGSSKLAAAASCAEGCSSQLAAAMRLQPAAGGKG
jgi:hypothetical protein